MILIKLTTRITVFFICIPSVFAQELNFRNTEPVWSPDGKQIVFTSQRDGKGEIYVMNSDGTEQINLTKHPDGDNEPQWSPDGSKILWISNRTGIGRIFTMNRDGSNAMELTHNGVLELTPSWSPSGKKIAFASTLLKNTMVFVVNADGTQNRQATQSTANLSQPVWSPDETKISCRSIGAGGFSSIIINMDDHSNIPASKKAGWIEHIGWSFDGTRSFFSSSEFSASRKRLSKIYYVESVTGKTVMVVKNIEGLINVEIAPDGNHVLYECDKTVFVINSEQKKPIEVGRGYHSAKWSPDGQKIVMVSTPVMNIFTVNPDGTALTQLTK